VLERCKKSVNSLVILSLAVAMIAGLFLFTSFASASDAELNAVQQAITEKGAQWTAGETSVSVLPKEQRMMRFGGKKALVKPKDKMLPKASAETIANLPAYLNYNEQNYVSPIEDQGQCGSCWAFSSTAALESQVLMSSSLLTDESEQVLLSCTDPTFKNDSCNGGYAGDAADFIKNTGLPPVSYYPYTGKNGNCANAESGWKNDTYKISSWSYVDGESGTPTVDDLKAALNTYGPLVVWMEAHDDLSYYTGGIYTYSYGSGDGHFILLIGYDDSEQCFIVKNSWGTDWGETEPGVVTTAGFFRIAYSENTGQSQFGTEALAFVSGSQPAAATHFSLVAPSPVTIGQEFSFTITALDANNNVATGYTGTVDFNASCHAWVPNDSTLSSGVGTFNAIMETAGTQYLTAADYPDSSIAGTSNPISVLGILSISGSVTTSKGNKPIPGVLMTLSNGQTTTTNSQGKFSFTQLGSGTYTVTPSASGYTFSPSYKQVILKKSNVSNVSFKGKAS